MTEITISEENYVRFVIYGDTFSTKQEIKVSSDPKWIRDEGTGSVSLKNFKVHVNVVPTRDSSGHLQIKF